MTSFRLTPAARDSLKTIAKYTETRWGKTQRDMYLHDIDAAFHSLAAQPHRGQIRPELHDELRSYPIGNHTIYYLCETKHITIVDILHQRMDASSRLNQLTKL